MSFGDSDGSVQISTSDKGLGSDHENLIDNPEKLASLDQQNSKSKKHTKEPIKQKSHRFDSVRNAVKEVGKDLNQSGAYQDHMIRVKG